MKNYPIYYVIFLLIWLSGTVLLAQNAELDEAKIDKPGDFFVSTTGNDANAGTSAETPFATLARAQQAVREARIQDPSKPRTVVVGAGDYSLDKTLEFTSEDSGSDAARVTWRTVPGETVRLLGGKYLNSWQPVVDPAILDRLRPETRDKLIQVDLKAAGVSDLGDLKKSGFALYFDGCPMIDARYPNEGFLKITDITDLEHYDIRGTVGSRVGIFYFDDERMALWGQEKDPWLFGYWFWDWSSERQKIESIDVDKKMVTLVPPYHDYGFRKGQWFYGFHLLCELDMPGEYYVDHETGMLYFYPPSEVKEKQMAVTVLHTIARFQDVSNLTFRGFTLEFSQDNAITLSGNKNLIAACTIRNISGSAIDIFGYRNTVFGCHLYNLGGHGIQMTGGNRATLAAGECLAMNNEVHHFGQIQRVYAAGISVDGVGNTVSHNKIYDAPHMALGLGGNEMRIEYNEIFNVCFESNDAGAFYTGRNWTMRGNVFRYNSMHDICGFEGKGCVGVYLDDQFSSMEIFGNVFRNVTRATMIGGGRDNAIVNNIFIDCSPCVHLDARGLGWQKYFTEDWIRELREKGTNGGINVMTPPYSTRYPELTRILDEHPGTPCGNVIARNIAVRGNWNEAPQGQWAGGSIWEKASEFNTLENNCVGEDPLFVDEAKGDYTLKPESPALKFGFQQIPWQEIGLLESPLRAKP